jgi:hypothetical protein
MLVAADGAGLNVVNVSTDFFEKNKAPIITRMTMPHETQVYGMGRGKNGTMWISGMDGSVYQFGPLNNDFLKVNNGQFLNNGYFTPDSNILISNNFFLFDGKDVFPLFDPNKTPTGNTILTPREELWENHHKELRFYDVVHYRNNC